MVKFGNNCKKYGLGKERELKKIMSAKPGCIEVTRARGSFGSFDLQIYFKDVCKLFSVKSVRQQYWSPNTELKKLSNLKIPDYCEAYLAIYWSPKKGREKKGWQIIKIK